MAGKDGDLLDELFYQSLIKLCDVGFLLGDEVLQLLDPVLTRCFCVGDFQAADVAPDDGFAAVIVPVDAPVKLVAENDLGKAVIAGEGALPTGRAGVNHAPSDKPCK